MHKVHLLCSEPCKSTFPNIGVTAGLAKEFPSHYVWNLALAKSTFSWLCTTDAFLSFSKYLGISWEENIMFSCTVFKIKQKKTLLIICANSDRP